MARRSSSVFARLAPPRGNVRRQPRGALPHAEREAVTADLARRLVAYLYRAERNPELRFEEAA